METLLVCLLAGYGVWLAAYLLLEKRQSGRPVPQTDVASPKRRDDVPDIVGKSSFRMTPKSAIPTPQAATRDESASATEKEPTFAPEAEKRSPARLADEELDAAFEHLEIPDVPLEYEDDEETDADEEMPLAVRPAGYASGVSFEQIDRAVRTASDASATDAERRQAGRVFGQIEGTELYDRLVSSSAAIGEKISGLMDCYLSQPISTEGDAGTVAVRPRNIADAPDDTDGFDIRDFV
ncbi:conjugal transfer protein TraD [uncultured Alistipes sp.]|uniref:conjugal transfer protein TraD n=1 Tax=uncultured Alistipes sp. TaxID=538949 RepID=UPI0026300B4D|nr:conjugal transfer protein TraD [uncultured Alistipes sp.]